MPIGWRDIQSILFQSLTLFSFSSSLRVLRPFQFFVHNTTKAPRAPTFLMPQKDHSSSVLLYAIPKKERI